MEPSTEKTPFLHGKRLPSAIVAGGAALAMTLAGLGIAAAQTDDSTTTAGARPAVEAAPDGDGNRDGARRHRGGHTHADHHPHARLRVAAEALDMTTADLKAELIAGRSIGQVAEAKGVAPQTVVDALVADRTTVLNAAVDEARLTREQADTRIATLPERMRNFVERTRPAGEEGRPGRKGPGRAKADPARIADVLGVTVEELRAGRQAGKSLATMATERGVAVQTVVDALVAEAEARLAAAVSDGKLTQAQADERRTHLPQRITALVNRTPRGHKGAPA